jgi:hypothetical protein
MNNKSDKRFLNRYFRSVYNKLEADALLFNRSLPHEGLKGSENEQALTDIIRDFLPTKYGVESNVLVIDREGKNSRQCDIVIYDNSQFPRYFRKVYPIETIFAVIEVKTELSKQQSDLAIENANSLNKLKFQPLLTPYWETKTKEEKISHPPPVHCIFGYRSSTQQFSTFCNWFSTLPSSSSGNDLFPYNQPFNHFIVCALDKGIIFNRGDGHIARWLTIAEEVSKENNFPVIGGGLNLEVDPAKALLMFLETLWTMLEQSPRHPGFDIRSYMDADLGAYFSFDANGNIEGG